jgi:hypothetical protein
MAHEPKRESIKCHGEILPKKLVIIALIASLTSSEKPAYYGQAYYRQVSLTSLKYWFGVPRGPSWPILRLIWGLFGLFKTHEGTLEIPNQFLLL